MSPNGKSRTRQRGDSRNLRSEHHPESPICTQGLGHCSEPIWLSGSMGQVLATILLSVQWPFWKLEFETTMSEAEMKGLQPSVSSHSSNRCRS